MGTSTLPMSGMDQTQTDIAHGPDNPQEKTIEQQDQEMQIPQKYKEMMVKTITDYRNQWGPDRLLRIPQWMRNVLMFRGSQLIEFDPGTNTYVDIIAWNRQQGKADVEDTYLEKYGNNITQMLEAGFVGTMSRGVPPTVVRPENAEILADVTTAKAAQEAVSIIERMNRIRQMVRIENNLLYLYGVYFKYTRAVMDGNWAGWDHEDEFGEIQVTKPDRFHCYGCGSDTPAEEMGDDRQCPTGGCGKPLGPESFFPSETVMETAITGQSKVARAMVKWSVHGPMEIDCDPMAKTLEDTPVLSFDQEVDVGSLRLTFPAMFEEIKTGVEVNTTANASYEKLRRNEVYSMGWGYTSDSSNQKPTYSQNWMQPTSYARIGDKEFANWMGMNFPDGCKVSMVGPQIVDIRKAILTKEWSVCLLHENVGMYPPAIADNVVPFNIRLNDAMDQIDDWIERCASGMTIYDTSKIDRREMGGRVMSPGVLNGIPTKGEGTKLPLADSIMQFEFKLDPQIFSYPNMLINMCELISGVTPQTFGGGTTDKSKTAEGQQQVIDTALTKLNIYWENLKEEHAAAAQNALECLQKLMAVGAVGQLWDVIQANGSEFRNKYVDWKKMQGHINVYPDIDQGLPQSPEQIRDTIMQLAKMASEDNPLAQALFDIVPNQETAISIVGPQGFVIPNKAQRARTLQAINTLMEQDYEAVIDPQSGQQVNQLPVVPDKLVEDFGVLRDTMRLFWQENGDYEKTNPGGWERTHAYYEMAVQMEAGQAAEEAQRQAQVKMAGMPPPPPEQQPDPMLQQAKALLLKDAADEVTNLQRISHLPPLGQNGSEAAQVSAGAKILQMATDVARLNAGGK